MPESMRIVILGLSITSSWGNGHATNYRGLVRALAQRGHDVLLTGGPTLTGLERQYGSPRGRPRCGRRSRP